MKIRLEEEISEKLAKHTMTETCAVLQNLSSKTTQQKYFPIFFLSIILF